MVVAANGDLFVNIQRGRERSAMANVSPGVVALRDTNGDGVADVRERFGSAGNTGIALHRGFVYQDIGPAIIRYPIAAGSLRSSGAPDTVVSGLPFLPGHHSRNFAIRDDGALFVNVGSPTNACQGPRDRQREAPGLDPCRELETRAGIWRFDADIEGQKFSPSARYATGVRNAVALRIQPADTTLFAVVHGRDQLHQSWPTRFTAEQNAELPAEELARIRNNDDLGWPYCYFDAAQGRKVLAPEYGGDGRTVGRCDRAKPPRLALPAHWAPNDLLFYTGATFPSRYLGGAFIAFHGSWNRAPLPQAGYNVTFVPFAAAQPTGSHELFATGFSGPNPDPNTAPHRPTGLAQGPDGALFVSDDVGGRIWRITYRTP